MRKILRRLFAPAQSTSPVSSSMSASECQALRQLLLLTQHEAATWIGNVSERSWQYWESGKRPVPEDVSKLLRSIVAVRGESVDAAISQIEAGSRPVAVWYQTADDWKWTSTPSDKAWAWKLHNSVLAELAGRGRIALIGFDEAAFMEWCKNNGRKPVRVDAEAAEHLAWAAEKMSATGASA